MAGRRRNGKSFAVLAIALVAVATVYFSPLGEWVAADPMPVQRWMKDHTSLALVIFGAVTLLGGALGLQRRRDQPDPGLSHHPLDPQQDGYLEDLRRKMQVVWIDQFLSRSLDRVVPAQLGLRERGDGITAPLRIAGGEQSDEVTDIVSLYRSDRAERRLVLLGEPGSGKTTQLLHLAEHLLSDESGPVPIVLSLSTGSWKIEPNRTSTWLPARRRNPKAEEDEEDLRHEGLGKARREQADRAVSAATRWLSWEVSRLYQVPDLKVRTWLRMDRSPIVLLLDGLDEIRDVEDRRRCIEVLSLMRSRLQTGIVVCSRTTEYFEPARLLRFGVAAEIMPLGAEDIDRYLADAGSELQSLRDACGRNAELVRLLDTPLALTVAVLAYRGRLVDDKAVAELLTGRLDHLWSAYLKEALRHRSSFAASANPRFGDEEAMGYLRALAQLMEHGGRDAFAVEDLNLGWVRTDGAGPPGRVTAGVYVLFALCAALGLTVYTARQLSVGYAVACVALLVLTAAAHWLSARSATDQGLSRLALREFVSSRWTLAPRAAAARSFPSILAGMCAGVSVGLLGGFDGLLLGLLPGVTAGAATAVLALPERVTTGHERERGKVRSMRTAAARWTLVVRVVTGLVALVACWQLSSVLAPLVGTEVRLLTFHLMVAAAGGAWLSELALSLSGWWSHRASVRSVLRRGVLPEDVSEFFSHVEEHIIMRRTVTGYAFLHRTLQSHLVGSANSSNGHATATRMLPVADLLRRIEQEERE
ncbi:NACHT domain-containing protein [Amycolatopsis sp. NPDC004747]